MLINTQALATGPIAVPIWAATQDAKAIVIAAVATAVVLGQTVTNMTNVGGKKKKVETMKEASPARGIS